MGMASRALFFVAGATLLASGAVAQDFDKVEITTTDLGGGLYMMQGEGGNLGVSVGDDGVLLIDDQYAL